MPLENNTPTFLKVASLFRIEKCITKKKLLIDGILDVPDFMMSQAFFGIAMNELNQYKCYFFSSSNQANLFYEKIGFEGIKVKNFTEQNFWVKFFFNIDFYFKYFLFWRTKKITSLKFKKIYVGDIILDSIIRYKTEGKFTLKFKVKDHYKWVKICYYDFKKYENAIDKLKPDAITTSHRAYSYFNFTNRICLSKNIPVYSFVRGSINKLENESDDLKSDFDLGKEGLDKLNAIPISRIDEYHNKRFKGNLNKLFADMAFQFELVNNDKLLQVLNLRKNFPTVCIMAPCITDSNYFERENLFESYYQWLLETVKLSNIYTNLNWIIKPHPGASYYGEEGLIKEIIENLDLKNLTIVPDSISTLQIFEVSDCITTIRGTSALESFLFNIFPVVSGSNFYIDHLPVIYPQTRSEYRNYFSTIGFKKEISSDIKLQARKLLYWYSYAFFVETSTYSYISSPTTSNAEYEEQWSEIYLKLAELNFDITREKYYSQIKEYLISGKKKLTGLGFMN